MKVTTTVPQNAEVMVMHAGDPLAKLPALAERLGVKPRVPDAPPTFALITKDGASYDLFDLINAALDRLDPPP